MAKIYVPEEYLNKPCYQVNQNYIRVFHSTNYNQQNQITDIYLNQDYQLKNGTATYNTGTQCDNLNTYTSDIYYRTDFPDIMLTFILMCIFCFIFPLKIFIRLFRRWQ